MYIIHVHHCINNFTFHKMLPTIIFGLVAKLADEHKLPLCTIYTISFSFILVKIERILTQFCRLNQVQTNRMNYPILNNIKCTKNFFIS
jgi:hypothetical protein